MLNPREPDWAHVARSLGKVLAVTVVLHLALGAADRVLWLFLPSGGERVATVHGTAARVANPDKRLSGGSDSGETLWQSAYAMWGEPRLAGRSEPERYEIVESLFGTVRAPSLDGPSGKLGDAISAVEANPYAGQKHIARKTIDGLPQTLVATAVVEFTRPMTTEQLIAFNHRYALRGGPDVSYIYFPASRYDDSDPNPLLNAVVWNRDMVEENTGADFTYQHETEPEPALREFRNWVGLLDEGDDLSAFGLSYQWLARAAEEGAVYGLVIDRWKLADLRALLPDQDVSTIRLADVAFDLG
ncbi:hypothetical protein HD597_009594 [Nonomuraea thailandensis]|uniref:Uncharacterized protein n=1 Tax=Nonomuraea thailandensis TaxID=1188745 RepID=A0A9X2K7L5_9ACTN|nr:hypothetical protein [Nonomuraea thailandensis]MCP2362574.1 hypothetical protein [Nonomuraea thailandensis]